MKKPSLPPKRKSLDREVRMALGGRAAGLADVALGSDDPMAILEEMRRKRAMMGGGSTAGGGGFAPGAQAAFGTRAPGRPSFQRRVPTLHEQTAALIGDGNLSWDEAVASGGGDPGFFVNPANVSQVGPDGKPLGPYAPAPAATQPQPAGSAPITGSPVAPAGTAPPANPGAVAAPAQSRFASSDNFRGSLLQTRAPATVGRDATGVAPPVNVASRPGEVNPEDDVAKRQGTATAFADGGEVHLATGGYMNPMLAAYMHSGDSATAPAAALTAARSSNMPAAMAQIPMAGAPAAKPAMIDPGAKIATPAAAPAAPAPYTNPMLEAYRHSGDSATNPAATLGAARSGIAGVGLDSMGSAAGTGNLRNDVVIDNIDQSKIGNALTPANMAAAAGAFPGAAVNDMRSQEEIKQSQDAQNAKLAANGGGYQDMMARIGSDGVMRDASGNVLSGGGNFSNDVGLDSVGAAPGMVARGWGGGAKPWGRSMGPGRIPFRDGGRVRRRRAPVTITQEPRYAVGGSVPAGSTGGAHPYPNIPAFNFDYRDYLANVPQGSESGSAPMTQDDWNRLSFGDQSNLVNFANLGVSMGANDPRYAAFAGTSIKPEENRPINFRQGIFDPAKNYDQKGNQIIADPSRVLQGDNWWAASADNETPGSQAAIADSGVFKGDKWDLVKAAALMGSAYLGGQALGAGALGDGVAGAAAPVIDESAGLSMANPFAGDAVASGAAPVIDESAGLNLTPASDESAGLDMANAPMQGGYDFSPMQPLEPTKVGTLTDISPTALRPTDYLRTIGRIAGPVMSAVGGGGHGSSVVPQISVPGGGVGTTVTTGTGTPAPNGGAAAPRPAAGTYQLPPDVAAALNPANFKSTPGAFSNWDEMRGRFAPVEGMILDMMNAGGKNDQETAANTAGADAAQAAAAQRKQARARLIAQGINPDDARGSGAELARLNALDTAKMTVGARNIARTKAKSEGEAKRLQAAGIASQMESQGLQADAIASQRDLGNRQLQANVAMHNADLYQRALDNAADRDIRWEQLSQNDRQFLERMGLDRDRFNADVQLRNAELQRQGRQDDRQESIDRGRGLGSILGGISDLGSLFGFKDGGRAMASVPMDGEHEIPRRGRRRRGKRDYRDGGRISYDRGGEVHGPGTSTSDSIKARLSNNEHVVNAEGVELADAEMPGVLDDLNRKGLMIRRVREQLQRGLNGVGLE